MYMSQCIAVSVLNIIMQKLLGNFHVGHVILKCTKEHTFFQWHTSVECIVTKKNCCNTQNSTNIVFVMS